MGKRVGLGDWVYCDDLGQNGRLLAVSQNGAVKLQLVDGSEVEVGKGTLRPFNPEVIVDEKPMLTPEELMEADYEDDDSYGYLGVRDHGWHNVRYPIVEPIDGAIDALVLTGIKMSKSREQMYTVQLEFNHALQITSYSMFYTDSWTFKPAKERGYYVFYLTKESLERLRDAVKDVYKVVVGY